MSQGFSVFLQELRGLGESFFKLVRAEIELLLEMWRRSLIELGKSVALLGAAAYIFLLCVPALLLFAAVDGLAQWLKWPYWGAALVVMAVVLLVAVVLALIARHILTHRFENPAVLLRRRLDDQRGWWHERVLYLERQLPGGAAVAPQAGEFDDDFE